MDDRETISCWVFLFRYVFCIFCICDFLKPPFKHIQLNFTWILKVTIMKHFEDIKMENGEHKIGN